MDKIHSRNGQFRPRPPTKKVEGALQSHKKMSLHLQDRRSNVHKVPRSSTTQLVNLLCYMLSSKNLPKTPKRNRRGGGD